MAAGVRGQEAVRCCGGGGSGARSRPRPRRARGARSGRRGAARALGNAGPRADGRGVFARARLRASGPHEDGVGGRARRTAAEDRDRVRGGPDPGRVAARDRDAGESARRKRQAPVSSLLARGRRILRADQAPLAAGRPGSRARVIPLVALLLVTAIWGVTFVQVKDAVEIYPLFAFLAVRFAIASMTLAPFTAGRFRGFDRRGLLGGLGLGGLLALGYGLQTAGLARTTVSSTGFITGLCVVL